MKNSSSGSQQTADQPSVLFGHEINKHIGAGSQLVGHQVLHAAGSIEVPKGISNQFLSSAMVAVTGATKSNAHDELSDLALRAPKYVVMVEGPTPPAHRASWGRRSDRDRHREFLHAGSVSHVRAIA